VIWGRAFGKISPALASVCPARSLSSANASRGAPSAPARCHGFLGRLSSAGSVAFPFTPPELSGGTASRFNVLCQIGVIRSCATGGISGAGWHLHLASGA
jgi:hypothetical protein